MIVRNPPWPGPPTPRVSEDMVERGLLAMAAAHCHPNGQTNVAAFAKHMRPTWEPVVRAVLAAALEKEAP